MGKNFIIREKCKEYFDNLRCQDIYREAQDAIYNKEIGVEKTKATLSSNIFHGILSNVEIPAEEKKPRRITQEGFLVMAAGGETTARVLTTGTFHLLANKDMVVRLKAELRSIMPEPTSKVHLKTLEQLPWLVRQYTHLNSGFLSNLGN